MFTATGGGTTILLFIGTTHIMVIAISVSIGAGDFEFPQGFISVSVIGTIEASICTGTTGTGIDTTSPTGTHTAIMIKIPRSGITIPITAGAWIIVQRI